MTNFNNSWRAIYILRVIALFGAVAAAIYNFFSLSEPKPNQEYGFYALILVSFGVFTALFILRNSFVKILKNPDLLVPLGLYIAALSFAGLFIQPATYLEFNNGIFSWTNYTFAVVFAFLLQIVMAVCFTGWMTRTILDFVETGKVDLIKSFCHLKEWFPRALGAIFFGSLPVYLLLFIIFPLLFQISTTARSEIIYLMILFIVVFSLIWNLATAILIPHVLSSQANLMSAIIEGIKISWLNKRKTFVPVILLMLVSGWIVYVTVTYNDPTVENKKFGEYSYASSYSIKSQRNFSAEFIWIGDYQEGSKWHTEMMKAVKQEPLETVSFRTMILMLILSLVVNLEIISRYFGKDAIDGEISQTLSLNTIIILIAGIFVLFSPVELFSRKLFDTVAEKNSPAMEELFTPRVVTNENILEKKNFFASGKTGDEGIEDIFIGDFDGKEGIEKVVVYRDKAIVFDNLENQKSEIKFNLGKTQDRSMPGDAKFNDVEIVDFDGDGVYEFIGIGSYPYTAFIVNQKGEPTFRYQGKEIDVNEVEAVDIDNDKRKELAILEKNFLKFFNREGKEIKSIETKIGLGLDGLMFTVNPNKSGGKAFLVELLDGAQLFDLDGGKIGNIKMPTNISGFLIEKDQSAHSLYFDDNKFGLFDLDGNLEAKYDAPLSEVKQTWMDKKISEYEADRKFYALSAQAKRFKVNQNGDDLLAVLALLSGKDYEIKSMLYIYDASGKIIYQELFNNSSVELRVMPSETRIEAEDLIVLEDKNIWRYTTQ